MSLFRYSKIYHWPTYADSLTCEPSVYIAYSKGEQRIIIEGLEAEGRYYEVVGC